jgi:hypothetical protein
MAPTTYELSGSNDLWVGEMSGACLSSWMMTSWRRRPQMVARLVGYSHMGIPTRSLRRAETHVAVHTKSSLLLSDFKQNCNVSTNFSKNTEYKISRKFIQKFSSCSIRIVGQTDKHCEANMYIFAAFSRERLIITSVWFLQCVCVNLQVPHNP